jgi:hypothetical protein
MRACRRAHFYRLPDKREKAAFISYIRDELAGEAGIIQNVVSAPLVWLHIFSHF